MMKTETTHKLTLISLAASLLMIAAAVGIAANRGPADPDLSAGDPAAAAGSEEKFYFLASQSSNSCGLQGDSLIGQFGEEGRIQGSCCSTMDIHSYQEQIEALKQYSGIAEIPPDPYDVSVAQARVLLAYQQEITLTSEQQEVYKEAAETSEEGGPCCCKCWHWDAYEGLAKKLIAGYDWSAEQVAELWDLSDACGGPSHAHG